MMMLDDTSRSIVSLLFGLFGVWMAHIFYQSPRSRRQVVAAWVLGFGYCAAASSVVEWVKWIPYGTYEHLSNIVGFGAIFVYLYLFPQILVAQRIFTYLFIDNSLYILVLLSRLIALRLTAFLPFAHAKLFIVVFILFAAVFLWIFIKILKNPIVQELAAFKGQLPILTVYACMAYVAMLAFVDPWAPMQPHALWRHLALLLLSAATVCGYAMAFYLMRSLRREQQALAQTHELTTLLAVSQQHYGSLVERIEQERALRHDFVHHLRTLDAMHKDGRQEYLGAYLTELLGHVEAKPPVNRCACYVANVLLDYYATQAEHAGIAYHFDAVIPEWNAKDSPKLCVVLGNLLQNALEACQRLPQDQKRFFSLLARVVNGNLTIEVKNSFDGIVKIQARQFASRKKETGHGLGLASVKNILEQEEGYFETFYNSNIFTAKAVLKMQNSSKK